MCVGLFVSNQEAETVDRLRKVESEGGGVGVGV